MTPPCTPEQAEFTAGKSDLTTNDPVCVTAMPPLTPYVARRMGSLGSWNTPGFRIKVYGIRVDCRLDDALLPDDLIAAARDQAALALTEARQQGGHYGFAYVVLHAGEEANWLLVDWWQEGGIVCQRLFSAPRHATVIAFEPAPPDLLACVWELVVIQHERDAWVRAMLTTSPDPARYLDDRLPAGLY